MREPETSRPPADWWPAEWVEQATRDGMAEPPVWWRTNDVGVAYLAVAWNVSESSAFERELAVQLLESQGAVAAARALLESRRRRPDLATDTAVGRVWPNLSREQRMNANEILAAIVESTGRDAQHGVVVRRLGGEVPRGLSDEAAAALEPGKRGRRPWTRALFEEHWEEAYGEAAAVATVEPTLAEIAAFFRLLDGTVGTDPEYVRKLRSKARSLGLPE